MNKYQSDTVAHALGDLQRASAKIAMVATQLVSEAAELDGAPRAAKANQAIALYTLSGSVLVNMDKYTSPVQTVEKRGN